jgi:pimeloyl-ACP methyl ester carboxylesterase
MAARSRVSTRSALGAVGALAVAAAGVAVQRSPVLRQQAGIAVDFARGRTAPPSAPIPPPLPPGSVVALPGRGEVFVRDTGPRSDGAPTLLMLHGWTVSADINFFAAYETLAGSYRVVALDHRGHGRGMRSSEEFSLEDCADDAAALLRVLDVPAGRTIALGYSMGGPIALLLARRHPELVAGLVSQATALEWRESVADRGKWLFLSLAEVGLRVSSGDGVVERVMDRAVDVSPEIEPLRSWLEAEIQRGLGRALVDAGRALSKFDSRPWAHELKLPAVVCVTLRDKLVPPRKQRVLAKKLRADIIEIDGDHDVTLVDGPRYAAATLAAVEMVAGKLLE